MPTNTGAPITNVVMYLKADQPVTLPFVTPPAGGVAGWNVRFDFMATENGPILFSIVPTLTDSVNAVWSMTVTLAQMTLAGGPGRYFFRVTRTDSGTNWVLGTGPIVVA